VASLDVGFPMRGSHSTVECCDISDLEALVHLLDATLDHIPPGMRLDRC
jgi:putative aminopeptidase FrvX